MKNESRKQNQPLIINLSVAFSLTMKVKGQKAKRNIRQQWNLIHLLPNHLQPLILFIVATYN